jgi:hypothetical protein
MRPSQAVLVDTGVRLWELVFPKTQALLARTRVPYVSLDGLIAFSKQDRDGKVDAYLAAYLPDELILVFFLAGDVVNAAMLTPLGRFPVPIAQALQHIEAEAERSEIEFHQAPRELLAAMYAACAQSALLPPLETGSAAAVFKGITDRGWSGTLELISNGRVNYVLVKEGRFTAGFFSDQRADEQPGPYLARLFTSVHPEPLPKVIAAVYPGLADVPLQAPPAMVAMLRNVVWNLSELAEQEQPGEGGKRAERARQRLMAQYRLLGNFGGMRGVEGSDPLAEPATLSEAIGAWTKELCNELEIVNPGCAARLVKEATREHRFALGAIGFFERLPWRIQW